MDAAAIDKLREQGEGATIEFKRGGQGARDDAFESYCAFLNRDGGELLLGVADDGTVVGLPPNAVKDIVKNLISGMNDANLLNPPFCALPEVVDYAGRQIICRFIPPLRRPLRRKLRTRPRMPPRMPLRKRLQGCRCRRRGRNRRYTTP